MADFVQTMKDWRRMCDAQDNTTCGPCSSCPMGDDGKSCMAVYEDEFETVDFAHIEQTVTEWAAEHPEPVYPTWEEWLQSVGVMESSQGLIRRIQSQLLIDGIPAHAIPTRKVLEPIPADIAQKLGIQPKPIDYCKEAYRSEDGIMRIRKTPIYPIEPKEV